MPLIGSGLDSYEEAPSRTAGMSVSANQAAANQMQHETYNPLTQILGYSIGGAVDLADTVASSVSAVLPGSFTERGDWNQAALDFIGKPGLNKWYAQNKSGLEATSGIEGVIAAEMLTRRFAGPASAMMGAMRATPYLKRIALLDRQAAAATQTVNALTKVGLSRGYVGSELARTEATLLARRFDAGAGTIKTGTVTTGRAQELWKAKGFAFGAGVRDAAAVEATMALTLNQNGFLYDDSAAYNIAFGGIGLAAGGLLGAAGIGYRARKWANSDLAQREAAGALDPELHGAKGFNWFGLAPRSKATELDAGDWLAGSITDKVSFLGKQITDLRDSRVAMSATDNPTALASQRNRYSIQLATERTQEITKVTTKGISTDGMTRFNDRAVGHWRHLENMVERDPLTMQNAEMVGGVADDMNVGDLVETHFTRVADRADEINDRIMELATLAQRAPLTKAQAEELRVGQQLSARLRMEGELTPMVSVDREWMPMSEGESISRWTEPKINPSIQPLASGGNRIMLDANPSGVKGAAVALDSNLTLTLPGKKTMESADLFDSMRAWRLADDMIERMGRAEEPFQINLPSKPTWFQLDMAEEIQRRNANASIRYPGQMTRETAQVESFIQKAEGLKREEALNVRAAQKKGVSYSAGLSAARIRYNLPRMTAYERGLTGSEESGLEALLRGMGDLPREELEKMSLTDLKSGVAQFKRVGDAIDATANDIDSLMGNSFKFMKGESGETLKPLVGMFRKFDDSKWATDSIAERLAERKQRSLAVMVANEDARLSKTLSETIVQSADFDLVSRPDMLNDLQIQGSVFGSMPGSGFGAASRAVKTSEHNARDNPRLLAAIRLRDQVSRVTRDHMERTISEAFGDNLKILNNGRNESTKLLLNQFHSLRSGWDLNMAPVKLDDGFYGFRLGDTVGNRERWQHSFGVEMPVEAPGQGPMLQTVDGRMLVLDELGVQVQAAYNKVSSQIVTEKNQLLESHARQKINVQNHFVPSPDIQGKHVAFVMGPDGKTVKGYTIVEDTESGYQASLKQLDGRLKDLPNNGMGYTIRTQEDVRSFASIWDREAMDMFDPNITAIQPGKKATGATVGREVKTDAFQNSLRYLQDSYLDHGQDVMESLLKEQINGAKARSAISANIVRDAGGNVDRYKGVHDYFLENLLGRNKLTSQGSFAGPTMKAAEKALDKVLETASVNGTNAYRAVNMWFRNKMGEYTGKETAKGAEQFRKLTHALGDYMPFKSAEEMMTRQFAGHDPLTTAKITGGMNQFAAAMMLRVMEVGQPIMNMAGIINAMPSVIRHFQPSPGESAAEYGARIGHSATIFNLDDGRSIGIADMAKIGKRAMQRAWNRESHADYDFMMGRGYLTQEVAEFQRQFGAIDTPGKWKKFFMGDGVTEAKGAKGVFKSRGLVGAMSVLSDRSEDLSRGWGHMIGLEMADILKLEGMETRHAFAHDIANKMIANYNPANRPEIFQGALGAPLGLFQSFVQSYYQRMFRYIETGDKRAFATQYATQSALFGITGLAGYKEIMGTLGSMSDDGDAHPAGGFLGHGLLGQIPAMFGGAPVDFSSRGDTSIRVPGVGDQQLPGMAVASKLYEGTRAAIGLLWQDKSNLTATQIAEVVSNSFANRPIAGMIEQFGANGIDTDAYGQVVSESRGVMESAYRMIGLRSQRQAQELEAFYSDKNSMEHKAAMDDRLRQQTRAAMRQGAFDKLPGVFESYLQNGGDAKHFKRWMKENYEAATTTRAERQLEKLLKNPAYFDRAQRMMDMGVDITQNETYSEDDLNGVMGTTESLLDAYNEQQASQGDQSPIIEEPESPYGY